MKLARVAAMAAVLAAGVTLPLSAQSNSEPRPPAGKETQMMRRTVNAAPVTTEAAPNPAPYPYRDYLAARALIESSLSAGVFYGLVLGGSGTGKTSLVRELAQTLDRREHQLLYLSTPRVSLLSVTRYFAQVLRVTTRLVEIHVIAQDRRGNPVAGLTRDDFIVKRIGLGERARA